MTDIVGEKLSVGVVVVVSFLSSCLVMSIVLLVLSWIDPDDVIAKDYSWQLILVSTLISLIVNITAVHLLRRRIGTRETGTNSSSERWKLSIALVRSGLYRLERLKRLGAPIFALLCIAYIVKVWMGEPLTPPGKLFISLSLLVAAIHANVDAIERWLS